MVASRQGFPGTPQTTSPKRSAAIAEGVPPPIYTVSGVHCHGAPLDLGSQRRGVAFFRSLRLNARREITVCALLSAERPGDVDARQSAPHPATNAFGDLLDIVELLQQAKR